MTHFQSFRIGTVRVEPGRLTVLVDGEARTLEPVVMRLLTRLAGAQGKVVSRDELISSVWPDGYTGDGSLSRAIWSLRQALGDDASNPSYVETIPKVGYRIVSDISVEEVQTESASELHRLRRSVKHLRVTVAALVGALVVVAGLWQMAPAHDIHYQKMVKMQRPDGSVDTLSIQSDSPIDVTKSPFATM